MTEVKRLVWADLKAVREKLDEPPPRRRAGAAGAAARSSTEAACAVLRGMVDWP